jgi:hypothetical protein
MDGSNFKKLIAGEGTKEEMILSEVEGGED